MTGRTKWLAGALVVSLAANLFLAGYLAGGARNFHRMREHSTMMREIGPLDMNMLRSFAGGMPSDIKRDLGARLRTTRAQTQPKLQRMAELRAEIAGLMQAEKLDIAAVRSRYKEMRALSGDVQRQIEEIVLEAAGQMSAADRAALFQRERPLQRWQRHHPAPLPPPEP